MRAVWLLGICSVVCTDKSPFGFSSCTDTQLQGSPGKHAAAAQKQESWLSWSYLCCQNRSNQHYPYLNTINIPHTKPQISTFLLPSAEKREAEVLLAGFETQSTSVTLPLHRAPFSQLPGKRRLLTSLDAKWPHSRNPKYHFHLLGAANWLSEVSLLYSHNAVDSPHWRSYLALQS